MATKTIQVKLPGRTGETDLRVILSLGSAVVNSSGAVLTEVASSRGFFEGDVSDTFSIGSYGVEIINTLGTLLSGGYVLSAGDIDEDLLVDDPSLTAATRAGIAANAATRESLSRHFRNYYTFGDSITTDVSSTRYPSQLATELGASLTNSAVSGRGVRNQAVASHTAVASKTSALISWAAGINDLNRATNKTKTLRKIEACIYSMLLNAWGDAYISSGNAAVTITGTTGDYNAVSVGGKVSGAKRGTGIPWTMSWDFTGDAFGLGMIASDGVANTFGSATVSVDGVVVDFIDLARWYDGLSDGDNANQLGPLGRIYSGLGSGSHTVLLSGVDGVNFVVDFFATLLPRPQMPTVMLHEITYQTAASYTALSTLNSDAFTRQANAIIRRIVTSLSDAGFPILLGQTNSYIDPSFTSDGLHWTIVGHTNVAQGLLNDIHANSSKYQTLSLSGITDAQAVDLRSKANTIAAVDDSTTGTNAATAATEIGKVHRSATAVAAGAAMRRTKAAATSTTLDETLGATP